MTGETVGRLWDQYSRLRREVEGLAGGGPALARSARRVGRLRDRLLVNYSPLVKYVAGRVSARMTAGPEREELFSWGILGLLDAIETFDSGRGTRFETYAISKIRWAMIDELRKRDWMPRRLRARAREAERIVDTLTQSLGRVPTEEEVAGELGIGVTEYRSFRSQHYRARITSLEARIEADGTLGSEVLLLNGNESIHDDPQAEADRGSVRDQLVAAIEDLREQERLVVTFYFYEGLTLKEIGKALGLSEGRISQILRGSIHKLREYAVNGLSPDGP